MSIIIDLGPYTSVGDVHSKNAYSFDVNDYNVLHTSRTRIGKIVTLNTHVDNWQLSLKSAFLGSIIVQTEMHAVNVYMHFVELASVAHIESHKIYIVKKKKHCV